MDMDLDVVEQVLEILEGGTPISVQESHNPLVNVVWHDGCQQIALLIDRKLVVGRVLRSTEDYSKQFCAVEADRLTPSGEAELARLRRNKRQPA